MTLSQQAEAAITGYIPVIRQTNAILFDEYTDYVQVSLRLLRDWYQELEAQGATDWVDPPANRMAYINDNRPWS